MFKNIKGLGDVLAILFYPVGLVLRRLGYDGGVDTPSPKNVSEPIVERKSCGCKARQQKLNEIFPFK
jgi:hypothetical protein